MSIEAAKLKAFLDELSALTRKHELVIRGCGCCGSPSITAMDDDDRQSDRVYVTDAPDGWTPSNSAERLKWKARP